MLTGSRPQWEGRIELKVRTSRGATRQVVFLSSGKMRAMVLLEGDVHSLREKSRRSWIFIEARIEGQFVLLFFSKL